VIGWQCVRSQDLCERMKSDGREPEFRMRTGLPIHPEWPATKIRWVLENLPMARELAERGRLAFSQLDGWFILQLTKEKFYLTDHSTASRSGFYHLYRRDWDPELIGWFGAEKLAFPRIIDSSGDFGTADFGDGWEIPILGSALDQSAALLGQACTNPGDVKITYGTCTGFWVNLGVEAVQTQSLSTSVAWSIDGTPTYAIAGEGHSAAAALEWLLDRLKIGWSYAELAEKAASVPGDEAPVFITALSGLGAPYWTPETRGTLYGLTGATGPEHLVRASLEAVALSVRDLAEVLEEEGLRFPDRIVVDGGMTANDYLMQFQADILGRSVLVPRDKEGTSMGVAFLAGLASGYFPDIEFIHRAWQARRIFTPQMSPAEREKKYARWQRLLEHAIAAYP
jgi:glycerol kinase